LTRSFLANFLCLHVPSKEVHYYYGAFKSRSQNIVCWKLPGLYHYKTRFDRNRREFIVEMLLSERGCKRKIPKPTFDQPKYHVEYYFQRNVKTRITYLRRSWDTTVNKWNNIYIRKMSVNSCIQVPYDCNICECTCMWLLKILDEQNLVDKIFIIVSLFLETHLYIFFRVRKKKNCDLFPF